MTRIENLIQAIDKTIQQGISGAYGYGICTRKYQAENTNAWIYTANGSPVEAHIQPVNYYWRIIKVDYQTQEPYGNIVSVAERYDLLVGLFAREDVIRLASVIRSSALVYNRYDPALLTAFGVDSLSLTPVRLGLETLPNFASEFSGEPPADQEFAIMRFFADITFRENCYETGSDCILSTHLPICANTYNI